MIALDATVGGASANAFVTLDEANSYMDGRLNASAWTGAADDDTRNRAIVEATRALSLLSWCGASASSTQALAWPRLYATNPDSPYGEDYPSTVIPQRVKDATCELAFQFLNAGTRDITALDDTTGIKRKKIDVIETEYFEAFQRPQGLARFPGVLRFISPLLAGSSGSVPVVRG